MQDQSPSIVPENESGKSSDTSYEVILNDEQEAISLFQKAKERLLNINQWKEVSGTGSAGFQLFDEHGNKADRYVQLGDCFQINIPAPGNSTGKGYDWVQVEAIEHTINDTKEVIAIRVRPTSNPMDNSEDVAHFFSGEASSTFSVIRIDKTVIATVQGRNEKPNVETESIGDNIRNAIIATGAILGLNKPQWKGLVRGLLDDADVSPR